MFNTKLQHIIVAQDEKACVLYTADDKNIPLLLTKELNPCMGIVLAGEVILNNTNKSDDTVIPDKIKFALLAHLARLSDKYEQLIKSNPNEKFNTIELYWKEILFDFIIEIENEVKDRFRDATESSATENDTAEIGVMEGDTDDESEDQDIIKDIIFDQLHLIRCIQTLDGKDQQDQIASQLQNESANQLKVLFSDQVWINSAVNECELSNVELSKSFTVSSVEELEIENSNGDLSHYECRLDLNRDGDLNVYSAHNKPKMTEINEHAKEPLNKVQKNLLFYTANDRPLAQEREPKRLKISHDIGKPRRDKSNKK